MLQDRGTEEALLIDIRDYIGDTAKSSIINNAKLKELSEKIDIIYENLNKQTVENGTMVKQELEKCLKDFDKAYSELKNLVSSDTLAIQSNISNMKNDLVRASESQHASITSNLINNQTITANLIEKKFVHLNQAQNNLEAHIMSSFQDLKDNVGETNINFHKVLDHITAMVQKTIKYQQWTVGGVYFLVILSSVLTILKLLKKI